VITDRVRRLAYLRVGPADSDTIRAQKAALTIAVLLVTGLAVIWVATHWIMGIAQAAAIPFVSWPENPSHPLDIAAAVKPEESR
jgi:hypothetical protein